MRSPMPCPDYSLGCTCDGCEEFDGDADDYDDIMDEIDTDIADEIAGDHAAWEEDDGR